MGNIDFGRHSEEYAAHRPGLPASFYQRIDAIARIGESRSLDLATGPGTIALELGALGSSVVGIDTSAEQIATANRVSKERDLEDKVHFRVAAAENTGLDASSFDLATAGQCWHWFDSGAANGGNTTCSSPGRRPGYRELFLLGRAYSCGSASLE
jgi:SAM-dependent methyltransferase